MTNLSSYELSDKQQIFLHQVVNSYGALQQELHVSKVPFLSKEFAVKCLLAYKQDYNNPEKRRILCKVLLAKFAVDVPVRKMVVFELFLNPAKVFKLGLREIRPRFFTFKLPFATKVEVGIQWNAFKKKWVSPVEIRNFHGELEIVDMKRKLFKFRVPASCSERTKEWLIEKCGVYPTPSSELKPTKRNAMAFLGKRRRR